MTSIWNCQLRDYIEVQWKNVSNVELINALIGVGRMALLNQIRCMNFLALWHTDVNRNCLVDIKKNLNNKKISACSGCKP